MSAPQSPKQIAEQYYIREQLMAGRKSAARRYAELAWARAPLTGSCSSTS